MQSADFWIGLMKIVWINIILSGGNPVVIAPAARSLPPHPQKKAVSLSSGAAVVLRIALTVVVAELPQLSFLQIVGGCLLLWIGLQLLQGDGRRAHHPDCRPGDEPEHVIAVAAAHGNALLLVLGLAISIPLVIFGSTLMIKLMERYPFMSSWARL